MGETPPGDFTHLAVHDFVPELGYREYWYPAVQDRRIRGKPVALVLLGEHIVFFRDTEMPWPTPAPTGALSKSVSGGVNNEFKGFRTCPHHGYTFDGKGQCVAALTDGPDSKLAPKLQARHYPTRTHRGIAYIWMGVTEPVPLEEDLPEEFFQDDVVIETYVKKWPLNWRLTMENSRDSHNSKIHRGQFRRLFDLALFNRLPTFWEGTEITEEGDNYICIAPKVRQDEV